MMSKANYFTFLVDQREHLLFMLQDSIGAIWWAESGSHAGQELE